jgi:hypothetical protein
VGQIMVMAHGDLGPHATETLGVLTSIGAESKKNYWFQKKSEEKNLRKVFFTRNIY